MKEFNFLTRLLFSCVGADKETLAQCTSAEVERYKILGTTVLIPTIIGFFSGSYIAYLSSGSLAISFFFGSIWSLIIFTIDRSVVAGTKPGKFTIGVLGRIIMALVISFTISEPVVLRIFDDAIQERRVRLIAEKQGVYTEKLSAAAERIRSESGREKKRVDSLYDEFIGEVDGSKGSKVQYRGPIAEMKWQAYERYRNDYAANETLRKSDLARIDLEKVNMNKEIISKDAKGFLGNLRILSTLTKEDPHVLWSVWLIRILFLSLELVPILVKLGGSPVDLYGKIVLINDKAKESEQSEIVETNSNVEKTRATLVNDEKLRRLYLADMKNTISDKENEMIYLFGKLKSGSELYQEAQTYVLNNNKDEESTSIILQQLGWVYNSYSSLLNRMINRASGIE
ncbi:DUF4407 domain-containing protein [Pedobacter aquatilis]|uniref:DUF4407 domain-containing protein n=1 Tax=Pedobacter aquatilis TaxID=351343 RepID=UPI00292D7632|nr:DUF4407 domain-containing protein [Pedobacter aquatilis]